MSTELKWANNARFQSFLLLGLLLFFVAHFVLLNPSSLEDDFSGMRVVPPKDLMNFLKNEPTVIAPEVPLEITPSYSLRESIIYSSEGANARMKMTSRKSNIYQVEQIAHSRDVIVELEDGTEIEAKEAVFFINLNKVHFYGSVHTTFPDGAELFSEYVEALNKPVTRILIPRKDLVRGQKKDFKTNVSFTSQGLEYADISPKELHLLQAVRAQIIGDKTTDVASDQATYRQEDGHLHFFMDGGRPLSHQFVKVHQEDLDLKSRTVEVETENQKLDSITALTDVWVKDAHDPEKISTATSGRAVYNEKQNEITLTEFPQVYQDNDTITGDVIIFHRNTDLIEVKQSNAIYNNNKNDRSKK